MKFRATFYILAALAATVLATSADIENDIVKMHDETTKLDDDITAFPDSGGSIASALAIHKDAVTIGETIDRSTSDVKAAGSISDSDAQGLLNSIKIFEPVISSALTHLAEKKAAFAGLPIGNVPALVLQDLKNLNLSTFAFESDLISAVPADLKANFTSIKIEIDIALANCIAVYSS